MLMMWTFQEMEILSTSKSKILSKTLYTVYVESKEISDNNNRSEWNHLRIIQTVPERHTGKG